MTEQQLRFAQQDLVKGSRDISSAGMRLSGTKYESDYRKLWSALDNLNARLIEDIRKGK